MVKEVKSVPNDKIAIICKHYDNENNTHTIIPTTVAIGKVDDNLKFHSENGEYTVPPIDFIEYITDPKIEYFYIYCDTIENVCKNYDEKDVNKAMMQYYMDIASHLILALINEDNVRIYSQDYKAISPEIQGELSKHYKPSNEDTESQVYINKKDYLPTEVDLNHIDKNDLASYLKEHIFENDSILDDIATIIAFNYSAKRREEVVSMLSIGNTGSGKTETYRLISEYLGVPFTMFDCTNMSASGYIGDSVQDLIKAIYNNSKDKPELMGKSIVVLEEIDKIASRGNGVTDINVQFELLKFLDGYTYHLNNDKNPSFGKDINIDTTFMTKAALGAFEEMFEKKKKENSIGFKSTSSGTIKITDNDAVEYGMSKQIMRRFILTFLYKDLNWDDLKRILMYSKSSPLIIKKEQYLRDYNTKLEYTDDYLDAITEYAYSIKSGAGGLTKAVIKSLIKADSAVYNRALTSDKSIKSLKVTRETVENPCKFTY